MFLKQFFTLVIGLPATLEQNGGTVRQFTTIHLNYSLAKIKNNQYNSLHFKTFTVHENGIKT